MNDRLSSDEPREEIRDPEDRSAWREETGLVSDTGIRLSHDTSRVITRFFQPGAENVGPGRSRAAAVVERVRALSEEEAVAALDDVERRFGDRHRSMRKTWRDHAAQVLTSLPSDGVLESATPGGPDSPDRPAETLTTAKLLLIGAVFTQEYAIEGAALCNPSVVLAPGVAPTAVSHERPLEFVMSVRGIGEGHRSTIGFRSGRVSPDGSVVVDPPDPFPVVVEPTVGTFRREPALPDGSYRIGFAPSGALSSRVLYPFLGVECGGMEDVRFVRFVDDLGAGSYFGTYTAFDGYTVRQRLLRTKDFVVFTSMPVNGPGAIGKGLALFPRKVNGRFAALTRSDRESNGVSFSDDIGFWGEPTHIQDPVHAWEVVQLGNCGSPIETDAGWIVLTHGVGALRTYSIGALLLDLDDPTKVIGSTTTPLLTPNIEQPGGYVPNAIYSCGAFVVGDVMILPYSIADQSIAVVTVSVPALLDRMRT